MKKTRSVLAAVLFICGSLAVGPSAWAQTAGDCITQGGYALALARTLDPGVTTHEAARDLLIARGVGPDCTQADCGWKLDECLSTDVQGRIAAAWDRAALDPQTPVEVLEPLRQGYAQPPTTSPSKP